MPEPNADRKLNSSLAARWPLSDSLDAPLAELGLWLENDSPRVLPENLRGQCCVALRELDETRQGKILDAAARVRFQAKAEQFRARARHAGWEQALWEGLFRALGYKHNVWPMQNLAESVRAGCAARTRLSHFKRGCSASAVCCRRNCRARRRAAMVICAASGIAGGGNAMSSAIAFCRARSGNFTDCARPIIRNAGWRWPRTGWRTGNLVSKLERWCAAEISGGRAALPRGQADRQVSPTRLVDSLREILEVERDEFWSWHWTFRSARLKKPQPLLGDARVTDLAVNVILPWLWTRAAEGKNGKLQRIIEHRYAVWPQAEDNSILKLARQRLLGVGRSRALRSASAQQGLIQITRDFCEHSNAVCENCRFPELVRGWNNGTASSREKLNQITGRRAVKSLHFQFGERIVQSAGLRFFRNGHFVFRGGGTERVDDCPKPAPDRLRFDADFWRACCAAAG